MQRWLRRALVDVRHAVPFLATGVVSGFIALFSLPVMLVSLLFGFWLLPQPAEFVRRRANIERRRVGRFTGEPIPDYHMPGEGWYPDQGRTLLNDRATRRDLYWLVLHGVMSPIFGILAVGLPLAALSALAVPFYWWALPPEDPAAPLYPVTSWAGALGMPVVAAGYAALALLLVPLLARVRVASAQRLLSAPSGAELTQRVAELTASRAAALEAHGAELRRIERDLHDGTQNRLVAVVMQLGIAERALRRDPDSALSLVLRAQNTAGDALSELRGVVRSIFPPVLAERGLDGAVAGLVARCPVPCELTVDGLRRVPAAVESAAYFVIAEALTNVAKHSGAEKAEVRLSAEGDDLLVIEVSDDGHGGADEAAGSGLAGIRRRVAAFDGHTELSSPPGGPTVLRAELPCES